MGVLRVSAAIWGGRQVGGRERGFHQPGGCDLLVAGLEALALEPTEILSFSPLLTIAHKKGP